MTAVIYRQLNGTLGWLVVREVFVDAAKRYLRLCGHPALAVIRLKRNRTGNAWECDDYD